MSVDLYGEDFFRDRSGPVFASACVVVPLIISETRPENMIDLGCGRGEWVQAFLNAGVEAFGVDIAAPEHERLRRRDLTQPLPFIEDEFDLVLCLETGEHLPEESADQLVESCVGRAPVVVFSAAVPGQEGIGHINCQPHEYWHEKFSEFGYEVFDPFRPALRGNPMVSPWYRDNIFLYQ